MSSSPCFFSSSFIHWNIVFFFFLKEASVALPPTQERGMKHKDSGALGDLFTRDPVWKVWLEKI